MNLQRAVLSAPPRLVLTVAVTPPQLQQAVGFALAQQLTSPPQHQIGRESLKHENPHEEESVAWAVDQREEEEAEREGGGEAVVVVDCSSSATAAAAAAVGE